MFNSVKIRTHSEQPPQDRRNTLPALSSNTLLKHSPPDSLEGITMLSSPDLDDNDRDVQIARFQDWRDLAVCKGQMHLFFAKKAERPQARERREAKAAKLCASCPVQPQCLTHSRENREYGYWAGESEEERHLAGYTLTAPIGIRARLAKDDDPIAS